MLTSEGVDGVPERMARPVFQRESSTLAALIVAIVLVVVVVSLGPAVVFSSCFVSVSF